MSGTKKPVRNPPRFKSKSGLQRPPRTLRVAEVEAALRRSAGIQSVAAASLKVQPPAICKFIKKHPQLQQVIDDVVAETVDLAVGKLIEAIGKGDMGAIRYYLDNKGQLHGFGIRKLAFRDGDGAVAVPAVLITSGKMTEEEWRKRYAPKTA